MTVTGIGNPFRRRFGVDDIEVTIDSHAQPEFVDRQALGPDARRKRDIARLVVGQAGFDVPQAVAALVSFRSDCALMSQLTGHEPDSGMLEVEAEEENPRILAYWVFETV